MTDARSEDHGPRQHTSTLVLGACGGPADPPGSACDPARGPEMGRFADVTAASGVAFHYTTNGFQGGGLAVVDLDGDALPELVAGSRVVSSS